MSIDWAVVFSTLLGPILAVWASEWRQQLRHKREQQERVFHTLMATRASRLSPEHIGALNRIEIAFPPLKHPKVADAWNLYLRHLDVPGNTAGWFETANTLFAGILSTMSADLKIPFTMTSIQHSAYHPMGYATAENQSNEIRRLVLELLQNQRSLSVSAAGGHPNSA